MARWVSRHECPRLEQWRSDPERSCHASALGEASPRWSSMTTLRRVAVIGGVRIPFCRSNTLYADLSNLDMLTAALNGLVDKYSLKGVHIDEAIGGAVVTHSKDWNLAREAVLGTKLAPHHARHHHACRPAAPACRRPSMHRGQDRHRRDRLRHRHGLRHDLGRADRVQAEVRAPPGRGAARPSARSGKARRLQGLLARRAGAAAAQRRRAAHGPLHGPAHRADGAGVEDHPRGAGPARLREPHEGGRGLPLGLHGRSDRAVRRRVPRQQSARGHRAWRRSPRSSRPSTSPSAAR